MPRRKRGLRPIVMSSAQVEKTLEQKLAELPRPEIDLTPVMEMIGQVEQKAQQGIEMGQAADTKAEDAKTQSAKEFDNLRTMIRNRDPRLETLEGIAAVVQERTDAADMVHLSLHTTDADIYSRLDSLQSLKAAQDALDSTQQSEIDALELQFAQQMAQLQALLTMPPSASAQDLVELKLRVKALEDARVEFDRQTKTLPALTLVAAATEQAFTWKKPFSDASYQLRPIVIQGGLNLSSVTVTEKAGTKTPTGVTLVVRAVGVAVSAGAILDVIAWREAIG